MTKRIVYIGGDAQFVTELEAHVAREEWSVSVAGSEGPPSPVNGKLVVFIVDCTDTEHPIEQVDRLRELNPGCPLIVVSPLCDLPLERVSLARMHGVESFHWKPLTDWNSLSGSLRAAFARISAWHELLASFERQHAKPCKVTFDVQPPTPVAFNALPFKSESEVCFAELIDRKPGMAVPAL